MDTVNKKKNPKANIVSMLFKTMNNEKKNKNRKSKVSPNCGNQ